MEHAHFTLYYTFGKAKPGLRVPSVLFWRAGAALHGRLQKIDVFLKANRSFCPETVWAPAPNAKQLLGKQFQSTKGSRLGEQSTQLPPVAPGDCTVPSQKSQQRIKHRAKKPQEIWPMVPGVWVGGCPLKWSWPVLWWPRPTHRGSFGGGCHWWEPLCWRGRGPFPGLSPAPPLWLLPPLNPHRVSTTPNPLAGVAQEHLLCPQTAPHARGLSASPQVLSPQVLPPASAN